VSNLDDTGTGSLRDAIVAANNTSGADTINFDAALSGQTIPLGSNEEFQITEALTIDATSLAANVTIDAQNDSRIFNITATSGDFTFAGLTLIDGQTFDNNVNASDTTNNGGAIRSLTTGSLTIDRSTVSGNSTAGSRASGGGIFSTGDLTLTSSTISGNSTTAGYADGGAIYTLGNVTLTNSTVSGNSTYGFRADGGAIFTRGGVTLTNSTLSGNKTTANFGRGGGILSVGPVTLDHSTVSGNSTAGVNAHGGGIFFILGDLTLTHSTVTENRANHATATGGGFWNNTNDTLSITHSIIAGNTAGGGNPDIRPGTGVLNVDFSLIGDTAGSGIIVSTGTGNILNQIADLAPLANNGGPTETHALLAGSPAIDAGDPGIVFNPAEFDQRGAPFVRLFDDPAASGTGVDIGAYERQTVAGLNLTVDTNVDENDGDYSAGDLSLRGGAGQRQHRHRHDSLRCESRWRHHRLTVGTGRTRYH